ncbi:hypothetical protein [Fuerstiella marisgermanici]|nr:hypothetical protein [Fuerstiella marisgermanici]
MQPPSRATIDWFLLTCLLAEASLVIATWPLWTQVDAFPAVPLFAAFSDVPVIVDRTLVGVLLLSLVLIAFPALTARYGRLSGLSLCMSLAVSVALVILNQHRLQPWHWLFMLVVSQTMVLREPWLTAIRRLTFASIYIFAAVSRMGPDVASGMTRQVLAVTLETLQLGHLLKNDSFVFAACLAMSVIELLCGLMLLAPATRRYGILLAVPLHAVLLLALGPVGLKHQSGVLIWNLFLLFAVPILFRRSNISGAAKHTVPEAAKSPWSSRLFGAFLFLFPLSGLFGLADNWLSWQLYSPRPEVVRVFVQQDAIASLPEPVRQFVLPPAPLEEWCPIRIDRWSLSAAKAPLYPEDRFQLAVAKDLAVAIGEDFIRIQIERPEVLWWHRSVAEVEAVGNGFEGYLLNANTVRKP